MPNTFDLFANKTTRAPAPTKELGTPGVVVYSGYLQSREKNNDLVDYRKHVRFEELLSNTSIIAAASRYYINLLAKAQWSVEPVDDSSAAKQAAELVERMMEEVASPWSKIVRQTAMFRFHGFAVQEWTAKRDETGFLFFDTIENRPQWTIERWDIDERHRVIGFGQRDPETANEIYIPRRKTVYTVDDTFSDQPDGLGVLRQVYKDAQKLNTLEDLETTGFERDLRGSIIARIPYSELKKRVDAGDITEADATAAIQAIERIAAMVRKSPDTAIAMDSAPYTNKSDTGLSAASTLLWNLELLQGNSSGLPDIAEAIKRKNLEIARALGVESIMLGGDGAGSLALSKDKTNALLLQVNATLGDIKEQYQKDLVERLWELNRAYVPEDLMPSLSVEEIQSKDVEAVAAVLRDMASAGAVLSPTDPIVNEIRRDLGYSDAEEETLI